MKRMSNSVVSIDESQRIRDLFNEQVRRGTVSDGLSDVSATPRFVRWSAIGDVGWSEISWTDLDEASADQVIDEQIEYFSSVGNGFASRIYENDLPDDLSTRLERAGFTHDGTSELMIARLNDLTIGVEPPEGVALVRANHREGIRRLIEVHEKVFQTDQTQLLRTLLAQHSISHSLNELVVAMANGARVSSSRVQFFPDSDFAGFWGGSTLPQWRGKGLYGAMVTHRARLAHERGYTYVYVIASNRSRPILERLSFESFGSVSSFRWQPAVPPRRMSGITPPRTAP
jgi:GNAT superfamily N-acetyltransferase